MTQSRRVAEKAARKLLAQVPPALPVDVVELARSAGISVLEHQLEPDQSGMLLRRGNQAVIVINEAHHRRRKRFSVAHELGHHFLDGRRMSAPDGQIEIRHRHAYHRPNDPQETQANYFAAEILMPEGLVREEAEKLNLDLHLLTDRSIQRLARTFDVSVAAMTIRLQVLGLIEPDRHW